MKILWITNILFPDICKEIGIKAPVTGGWMTSLAKALIRNYPGLDLYVASLYGENKPLLEKKINNITYYCLPFNEARVTYNKNMEIVWKEINNKIKPDIVHIHGTEFPYGLAYLNSTDNHNNIVISIQGLVGAYARYALGGITKENLYKYRTIYDYIKSSIFDLQQQMIRQGKYEVEYLKKIHNVIGRTDWDREHVWAINPNCKYFFCNENLRAPFYENRYKWDLHKCNKNTIFLSQAYKPIKGIHKLVEAMPYILRHYPNTHVFVGGYDFTSCNSIYDKLKLSTYGNYVRHLMRTLNVSDKFTFLGTLNEYQMAEQYQRSHIFVCPSSIENSPNSLGEAQLIGTPCIASNVGGISNMINHNITGILYRFEEYEMLAAGICKIFSDNEFANKLSMNGQKEAQQRHCWDNNAYSTYNIYKIIYNSNNTL